jgi:diguanylate cyclase (GGDEF)-like protein
MRELRFLVFPSHDFLQHKYQDHRLFSIIISSLLAIIWTFLWGWDVVIDPVGAEHTLGLRLIFLGALLLSLLLVVNHRTSPLLAAIIVVGMLAAEINFILILNQLDNGIVHGLGGLMYCMFIAILALQCFSLRVNVIYTLLATLLPHIAGLSGIAHDFNHLYYAALLWPAAFMAIITQIVQSHHFLMQYQLEKKLEKASITDPLSGAKNRRYFMPLLKNEISRARRTGHKLSLLMLDIDYFKDVNDTYGHPTGDIVICNLSNMCHQVVREIDVVARLGGEEFAILLPGCDKLYAVQVAERIRTLVAGLTMRSMEYEAFSYTISVGVAELSDVDGDMDDLLSLADAALYQAKEGGRNKVVQARIDPAGM